MLDSLLRAMQEQRVQELLTGVWWIFEAANGTLQRQTNPGAVKLREPIDEFAG